MCTIHFLQRNIWQVKKMYKNNNKNLTVFELEELTVKSHLLIFDLLWINYKISTRTFSSPFSSKQTSIAERIVFNLRSSDSKWGSDKTGAS